MKDGRKTYCVNMFRVCVDDYREDIQGRAYSPLCREEIPFLGAGELLLKMDRLFDHIGYPQAFQDKRSFGSVRGMENAYSGIPESIRSADSIFPHNGKLRTYDIAVWSRRNTSWQGSIYDAEGRERCRFDGEVELLEKLTELTENRQEADS